MAPAPFKNKLRSAAITPYCLAVEVLEAQVCPVVYRREASRGEGGTYDRLPLTRRPYLGCRGNSYISCNSKLDFTIFGV